MSQMLDDENRNAHDLYLGASMRLSTGSVRSLSLCSTLSGESNLSGCATSQDELSGSATEGGGEEEGVGEVDYSVLDRFGFIVVAPRSAPGRESERPERTEEEEERRMKAEAERRGRKEARRAIKWIEMLKSIEFVADRREWPRHHRKFESRLVKGIPECLRTKIWALFLNVPPVSSPSSTSYRELYLKISGFERQIDLDIERTLRDHILFKARFSSAQVSLFKILVAYSNHDAEVGYCQGMSTVAAFLLLYFEEEVAFNVLCRLMERDGLRTLFTAGFPLLFETFYVQEQLMKRYLPSLQARLDSFHITTSVYATKWYLTLFLGFPFSLATRIWDLFLFWGLDMLVCVSLALLKMHESLLLSLEYEACMQFLSKLPETPLDEKRLVRLAWAIWKKINPHYGSVEGQVGASDGRRGRRGGNPFATLRLRYGKLVVEPSRRRRQESA